MGESESFSDRENYMDHRQIGRLVSEAEVLWEETGKIYSSIKARQELLAANYFTPGTFVARHVIKADQPEDFYRTLEKVVVKRGVYLGIRTAYASSRLGEAPWIMRRGDESDDEIWERAALAYTSWMEEKIQPEALIMMENPEGVGDGGLAERCFILRMAVIPEGGYCLFEGRAWTDQTRSLEETTVVEGGRRVHNPSYDPAKIFRGRVEFDTGYHRVVGKKIEWDQRFLNRANYQTRDLISNVDWYLATRINFPDLIARMIALKETSGHETIQFQGRKAERRREGSYFDFFLGYNVRGAEEKTLVKDAAYEIKRSTFPWQVPFRE